MHERVKVDVTQAGMCLFLVIMDMKNMKAKPKPFLSVLFDDISQTPVLFDDAVTLASTVMFCLSILSQDCREKLLFPGKKWLTLQIGRQQLKVLFLSEAHSEETSICFNLSVNQ